MAAGAVAAQILAPRGIKILAHTVQVGTVRAQKYRADVAMNNPLRCGDADAAMAMEGAILEAKSDGDSVGGVVQLRLDGLPVAWQAGDELVPRLCEALVSIGAVKGVSLTPVIQPGKFRLRIAVKPTPSISLPQRTVNRARQHVDLAIRGRHDPCIVPRILPVTEAMAALVMADLHLADRL